MRNKIFLLPGALFAIFGMFTLQSCFYSGPRYPAYSAGPAAYSAYPVAPAYVARPPVVVLGDYDERHVWHERDWWVANRRDWVNEHHREWLEAGEHHEPGHEYH